MGSSATTKQRVRIRTRVTLMDGRTFRAEHGEKWSKRGVIPARIELHVTTTKGDRK